MFRNLRVKKQPLKVASDAKDITAEDLTRDPTIPITIRQINNLPENAKKRVYRGLLPANLLHRNGIDPITWQAEREQHVRLQAESGSGKVLLGVRASVDTQDEFIKIELSDNSFNGVDLDLLVLNTPHGERYDIDKDEQGQPTQFGTVSRNLAEEIRSMQDGLAPGQIRPGLGGSRIVLDQIESFLVLLGHRAYFGEPLTYASAWVFERRGFAYVRGHKLMDDIHREFQPGGRLFEALDGSTPFRAPDHWSTVRGRAWAIHDGILDVIEAKWDGLRIVKQVSRHAGVETFPSAVY